MQLTLVEKIAGRHADGLAPGTVVRSGDFISIRPRHVMTHDNTGAVIPKFKQIGATAIADPAQPVFAIDHDIQNTQTAWARRIPTRPHGSHPAGRRLTATYSAAREPELFAPALPALRASGLPRPGLPPPTA